MVFYVLIELFIRNVSNSLIEIIIADPNTGQMNFTCTVITMQSAPALKWLHHRMPAVLPNEKAISDWLNSDSVSNEDAIKVLQPFDELQFFPVSKAIGNIKLNERSNLKKVAIKRASTAKSSKCMESWLKVTKK